jgi:cytochrome c-type biogenesis protein CcmH/NrfF
MRRLRSMLAFALLFASPLAAQDLADVSLPDPQAEAQAVALMDTIRCVVCQGQPISGSNAGLAADMRRVIRERIGAGQSPDEVRAWLISRYGEWVTFEPVPSARTAPLWLVPLLALLLGAWLVSRRLRRKQRTST